MGNRIANALEIIEKVAQNMPECGTYQVNDTFYYMVQEYDSKPVEECRFEAHKRYIDIQYVVNGEEEIDIADISNLTVEEAYDETRDVLFGSVSRYTKFVLRAGAYTILRPEDVHRPGLAVDQPSRVRKIVGKVLVEK